MGVDAYVKQLARVGPQVAADGNDVQPRLDKTGAMTVVGAHAFYSEAVLRGNCYAVCQQTGTTTQAGLSATTPALTLYNPAGSGVNGVLIYAGVTFLVAFAAAAAVWVAVGTNPTAAAVTGTLTTAHRNCLLGARQGGGVIPMLAATLPAAPVAVAILGVGLTGAITTIPQAQNMGRFFDGSIIIAPGTNLSIQTSTASGASSTLCEYIWEEVPV